MVEVCFDYVGMCVGLVLMCHLECDTCVYL